MNKSVIIGVMVLIVMAGVFLLANKPSAGNASLSVIDKGDVIKIPLSSISENAGWFEHESNGVKIEYFVVNASDGSVKTAFNACDVCYRSKKGYRQEGKDMVCNNCGNYYAIDGLGTKNLKGGGCWPGYLPNQIAGDELVIKKKDLDKESYRFA